MDEQRIANAGVAAEGKIRIAGKPAYPRDAPKAALDFEYHRC